MNDLILETGKVQTRDGREVRIYATDAGGDYPVHGAIRCELRWKASTWTPKGGHLADRDPRGADLVLIPQAHYFNVYTGVKVGKFLGSMCNSVDEAKRKADFSTKNKQDSYEVFQYQDGEITKVEPEGGE